MLKLLVMLVAFPLVLAAVRRFERRRWERWGHLD